MPEEEGEMKIMQAAAIGFFWGADLAKAIYYGNLKVWPNGLVMIADQLNDSTYGYNEEGSAAADAFGLEVGGQMIGNLGGFECSCLNKTNDPDTQGELYLKGNAESFLSGYSHIVIDGNSYSLVDPVYVDSYDETRAFTEAAEQYFTEGSIHNIHLE